MLAIGLKSVVVRGFDVFGNILNKVFREIARAPPGNNMWLNMCSKSLQMSSGIYPNSAAVKPVSSAALASLARPFAAFNSFNSNIKFVKRVWFDRFRNDSTEHFFQHFCKFIGVRFLYKRPHRMMIHFAESFPHRWVLQVFP